MILNWKTTKEEADLIGLIADRAFALAKEAGVRRLDKCSVVMDLTAAHINAYPLDLAGLLAAGHGDFAHDVFGIIRHMDRDTGKLQDCFVPRYAKSE